MEHLLLLSSSRYDDKPNRMLYLRRDAGVLADRLMLPGSPSQHRADLVHR